MIMVPGNDLLILMFIETDTVQRLSVSYKLISKHQDFLRSIATHFIPTSRMYLDLLCTEYRPLAHALKTNVHSTYFAQCCSSHWCLEFWVSKNVFSPLWLGDSSYPSCFFGLNEMTYTFRCRNQPNMIPNRTKQTKKKYSMQLRR